MKTKWLIPLLLLAACGAENKADEAAAALAEATPAFEARRANLELALKEAAALRERPGVPELAWGERPDAKFLDARNNQYDKAANGRVFELAADSTLNTDAATLLGLFIDKEWPARIEARLKDARNAHAVESALADYLAVRYLCLLVTDDYAAAELGTGTLFTVKMKPGHWRGRAFYFDLEQGKCIGGKTIDVTNSARVEFKTAGFEEAEQRNNAASALHEDLRKQVLAAASQPK
jgi:hypothetical protein